MICSAWEYCLSIVHAYVPLYGISMVVADIVPFKNGSRHMSLDMHASQHFGCREFLFEVAQSDVHLQHSFTRLLPALGHVVFPFLPFRFQVNITVSWVQVGLHVCEQRQRLLLVRRVESSEQVLPHAGLAQCCDDGTLVCPCQTHKLYRFRQQMGWHPQYAAALMHGVLLWLCQLPRVRCLKYMKWVVCYMCIVGVCYQCNVLKMYTQCNFDWRACELLQARWLPAAWRVCRKFVFSTW